MKANAEVYNTWDDQRTEELPRPEFIEGEKMKGCELSEANGAFGASQTMVEIIAFILRARGNINQF